MTHHRVSTLLASGTRPVLVLFRFLSILPVDRTARPRPPAFGRALIASLILRSLHRIAGHLRLTPLPRRPPLRALAPLLLLPACAVGPDYSTPDPGAPASWHSLPEGAETRAEALGAWWEEFQDPVLSDLIHRAIARNRDLAVAAGRVEEARALYRADSADFYPAIDANGSVSRQRLSENLQLPGGNAFTVHSVDLSASWEIDLFGRIRRSVEASGANVDASEENRRNVLVAISAQVASSYVNLRTIQRRLSVARANLDSQARIVDLTRIRHEGGIASSLDVAQAESIYANTQTTIPPLEASQGQELNRLGVLLGEPPSTLWTSLSPDAPLPELPSTLAVQLPADIVRQRPDIRQAERELAAQTALIGVAKSDLYPRLTLLGSFGFDSTDLSVLFDGASRSYSAGPSIRWNIFAGGRLRALVDAQEARAQQALARYESTVLLALEEVENALLTFDKVRDERRAVAEAVRAASQALQLSTLLYKDGVADFQNVLDAQRVVFLFEDALARTDGALLQSLIEIYRALGGGWRVLESPEPPAPTDAQGHALARME